MNITNEMIDKFKVVAIKELEDIYTKLLNKNDFDTFVKTYLKKEKNVLADYETLDNRTIINKVSNIRKAKQSIVEKFIGENFEEQKVDLKKGKKDKATYACEKLNMYSNIQLKKDCINQFKFAYDFITNEEMCDKFEPTFGSKTFDEYLKNSSNELLEWALNNDLYISNFKYIKELFTPTKIKNLIKKDLDLLFYKFILRYDDRNNIDIYSNYSFFPSKYIGKVLMDPSNKKTTEQKKGNTFSYVHIPDDDKNIKITTVFVAPEDTLESVASVNVYNLHDFNIIKSLIKLSDNDFFTTKTVICDLGDIVELTFKNRNNVSYNIVYNSLKKITSFRSIYENKDTKEFNSFDIYKAYITPKNNYDEEEPLEDKTSNNVLNYEDLKTNKYRKLSVRVVFSDQFINSLIESSILLNDDITKNYKLNMAKALILPLMNERYKLINEDNFNVKLGYSYFNSVLTLGRSNKSRNLKSIESALTEIHSSGKIIKSFYRQKDFFYIEFFPLSKEERKSILDYLENLSSNGTKLKLPFSLDVDVDVDVPVDI